MKSLRMQAIDFTLFPSTMQKEALQEQLQSWIPTATFDATGEWLQVELDVATWKEVAPPLKADSSLQFDYLFCLTCVDWKTHLTMVYHLDSTVHRHCLVVKVKLPNEKPAVDTVSRIWLTAEFHEREVYEMFGVDFIGHPDLRLLILPDGWEGKHPLRKDYEDPINMIRL